MDINAKLPSILADIARDFLRFYGLVAKDDLAKKWNPKLPLLDNIDQVVNSHDCGLAALAMAIKFYGCYPEFRMGYLDICTNGNHWYIGYWNGRTTDSTLYWDTHMAWGSITEDQSNMRGYKNGCTLVMQSLSEALPEILNNDRYGQAILYQWLHLSFPGLVYDITGDDTKDLMSIVQAIYQDHYMFADTTLFPAEENDECIYSKCYSQVNA